MAVGWRHAFLDRAHGTGDPALCREGMGRQPRVDDGIELILDRSLKGGGWNYGNKAVFGRDLRPQPGPTGLALLALATQRDQSQQTRAAIDYLRGSLPSLRAGMSLGWGVLGLRAHGACPPEAGGWLAESYQQCAQERGCRFERRAPAAGCERPLAFVPVRSECRERSPSSHNPDSLDHFPTRISR